MCIGDRPCRPRHLSASLGDADPCCTRLMPAGPDGSRSGSTHPRPDTDGRHPGVNAAYPAGLHHRILKGSTMNNMGYVSIRPGYYHLAIDNEKIDTLRGTTPSALRPLTSMANR